MINPYAPPNSKLDGIAGVPGVSIRYDLTRWRYFRGILSMTVHQRATQLIIAAVAIWMSYRSWIDPRNSSVGDRLVAVLASLLVLAMVATFAYGFMAGLMVALMKGRALFGEHTLMITDAGLSHETKYNITVYKWFGIHKIVRRGAYHYVYTSEHNAHIVPSQVAVDGDVAHFMEAARTRIEQAQVKEG